MLIEVERAGVERKKSTVPCAAVLVMSINGMERHEDYEADVIRRAAPLYSNWHSKICTRSYSITRRDDALG